jgi:hypothetical protein
VELSVAVTAPVPLPGAWTFWADTIVGFTPLGPVTCTAFTSQSILSGFGTGSVTLPAESPALPSDRMLNLYSWRLWALYNGLPVWAGIPTGITDTAESSVTLTLTELPGYLAKRVIDTVGGLHYAQAEQTKIASDLAAPLADIGVQLAVDPGLGYLRDQSFDYLGSTARDQLLAQLSELVDGPEFRAEYYLDGAGMPQCRFRIAYPRVGSDTGLGLTVPGNATAYSTTYDTDKMRTRTYAAGALPAGTTSGTAPVVIVDLPQPDLPLMQVVDDWQETTLVSQLTDQARSYAQVYANPAMAITGTVPASFPAVGTYGPGDDVTLLIADPVIPGGQEIIGRLTEMDIDAAAGTVALTASTVYPPPKPRDTLAMRLNRDRVQLAKISHNNLAPVAAVATSGPPGGNR